MKKKISEQTLWKIIFVCDIIYIACCIGMFILIWIE